MAGTKTSTSAERQHPGSVTAPKKLDLTIHPKPLDATRPDPVLDSVDRTKSPGLLQQLSEALGQSAGEQPFINSEPTIGETPKDKPTIQSFNNTTGGIGVNGDGRGFIHITGGRLEENMGGGLRLSQDGKLQGTYLKGGAVEAIDIHDLTPETKDDAGFDDVYGGQFDGQKDTPAGGAKGGGESNDNDPGGLDRPTETRDRPSGGTPPKQSGEGGSGSEGGNDTGGDTDTESSAAGNESSGNETAGSSASGSSGSTGSSGSSESGQETKETEQKADGDSGDSGDSGDTPDPGGPEMVDPDVVFPYGGPRPKSDPGPDQEPSIEVDFQPEWWKGTEMERHDESWLESNLDLPEQIVSNPAPNDEPTGATGRARPLPADPVEDTNNQQVRELGEALLGRGEKGIRPEVSRPADDNPTPDEEQPAFPTRKPLPV